MIGLPVGAALKGCGRFGVTFLLKAQAPQGMVQVRIVRIRAEGRSQDGFGRLQLVLLKKLQRGIVRIHGGLTGDGEGQPGHQGGQYGTDGKAAILPSGHPLADRRRSHCQQNRGKRQAIPGGDKKQDQAEHAGQHHHAHPVLVPHEGQADQSEQANRQKVRPWRYWEPSGEQPELLDQAKVVHIAVIPEEQTFFGGQHGGGERMVAPEGPGLVPPPP